MLFRSLTTIHSFSKALGFNKVNYILQGNDVAIEKILNQLSFSRTELMDIDKEIHSIQFSYGRDTDIDDLESHKKQVLLTIKNIKSVIWSEDANTQIPSNTDEGGSKRKWLRKMR